MKLTDRCRATYATRVSPRPTSTSSAARCSAELSARGCTARREAFRKYPTGSWDRSTLTGTREYPRSSGREGPMTYVNAAPQITAAVAGEVEGIGSAISAASAAAAGPTSELL